MYAQMVKSENTDSPEFDAFQARIDAGERMSQRIGCPMAIAKP